LSLWTKFKPFFLGLWALILMSSCAESQEDVDLSEVHVEWSFTPLEDEFFSLQSREDILAFLLKHEQVGVSFFGFSEDNPDLVEQLYDMLKNPAIQPLYEAVKEHYGDYQTLKSQLETAFRRIKYYYPDYQPPKVYTMVTGMGSDLYVGEDIIVIGVDFFMGEGAAFRPNDLPNYILQRYNQDFILPAITLLISDRFNEVDPEDESMLAEMIASGKAYYFTKKVLPEVPDQILIAYSDTAMNDVQENEPLIWAHFIERTLLYETSHFIKNKYLGERPFVAEIGRRCPGRIGAWLGWSIVTHYMQENPTLGLRELMDQSNAQVIFQGSKYKPGSKR